MCSEYESSDDSKNSSLRTTEELYFKYGETLLV